MRGGEPRRTTGYLGLNPMAHREATALRAQVGPDHILTSLNDPVAERGLRDDRAIFELVTGELGIEVADFPRWDRATDVLLLADRYVREQLADLLRWFARAERGDIELDRLVLSGHGNGVQLWGEHDGGDSRPGTLEVERDLAAIAAVFPAAAGRVRDVMFSSCFSVPFGEAVRNVFGDVRTVWSYGGFSPTVATGSIDHILAWEAATGDDPAGDPAPNLDGTAIWTRDGGYVLGDPASAEVGPLFAATARGWREIVAPMYRGSVDLDQAQLDDFYVELQRLLAHPGATEDVKVSARRIFHVVLRLRYWPRVAARFGEEHGEALSSPYEAIGVAAPTWATLHRPALKAHVEAVEQALGEHDARPVDRAALDHLLFTGLWALDPTVVPSDWI